MLHCKKSLSVTLMTALYPRNPYNRALVTNKKPLPLPLPFDTITFSGNFPIKYLGLGAGITRNKKHLAGRHTTEQSRYVRGPDVETKTESRNCTSQDDFKKTSCSSLMGCVEFLLCCMYVWGMKFLQPEVVALLVSFFGQLCAR